MSSCILRRVVEDGSFNAREGAAMGTLYLVAQLGLVLLEVSEEAEEPVAVEEGEVGEAMAPEGDQMVIIHPMRRARMTTKMKKKMKQSPKVRPSPQSPIRHRPPLQDAAPKRHLHALKLAHLSVMARHLPASRHASRAQDAQSPIQLRLRLRPAAHYPAKLSLRQLLVEP